MCELTSLRLDDFSDTVTHILTIFWGESLVFFLGGGGKASTPQILVLDRTLAVWGCAAGWGCIFIRVTRTESHIFGVWGIRKFR